MNEFIELKNLVWVVTPILPVVLMFFLRRQSRERTKKNITELIKDHSLKKKWFIFGEKYLLLDKIQPYINLNKKEKLHLLLEIQKLYEKNLSSIKLDSNRLILVRTKARKFKNLNISLGTV